MKIYTKTGDRGETALFGGQRVPKDHPRVDAYGAVDELNALLGVAVATLGGGPLVPRLERVQAELFVLGADLATPQGVESTATVRLDDAMVTALEAEIDAWDAELASLQTFILPGGTPGAAALHHARTVCRRAERRVLSLAAREPIGELPIRYLNRLSDWLFTAARAVNAYHRVPDRPWISPRLARRGTT